MYDKYLNTNILIKFNLQLLFICIVHYESVSEPLVFVLGIENIRLFLKLYLSLSLRAGSKYLLAITLYNLFEQGST